MKTKQPSPARKLASRNQSNRCNHLTSDGRRCRMPRSETHPALCLMHAREEQQLLELDRIGAELASLSGHFKTSTDVNHVLGKLFTLLANNRIPPRNAATLAYIGQLLLCTLPKVKQEFTSAHDLRAWENMLRQAFPPQSTPTQRT
jgi:hypothetical protein